MDDSLSNEERSLCFSELGILVELFLSSLLIEKALPSKVDVETEEVSTCSLEGILEVVDVLDATSGGVSLAPLLGWFWLLEVRPFGPLLSDSLELSDDDDSVFRL